MTKVFIVFGERGAHVYGETARYMEGYGRNCLGVGVAGGRKDNKGAGGSV